MIGCAVGWQNLTKRESMQCVMWEKIHMDDDRDEGYFSN